MRVMAPNGAQPAHLPFRWALPEQPSFAFFRPRHAQLGRPLARASHEELASGAPASISLLYSYKHPDSRKQASLPAESGAKQIERP